MKSFKELLVWQKSISLTEKIYKILLGFPKNEQYNITDQIKRCSISIPSNIAEGYSRNSTKEYLHFLYISRGSISELETQIIIANKLDFINENDFKLISENIEEIGKMLSGLINSLNNH